MATIQFIDTGTIAKVTLSNAFNGQVKDHYRPTICGAACQGMASTNNEAYLVWLGMIRRCYDKQCKTYNQYGAKGVTVCDRWLCFEYFLEDLKFIPNYDLWINSDNKYELDKDIKQMNVPEHQKIYSLQTTCFIDKIKNIKYASIYQKNNNSNNYSSNYIGVSKSRNNYRAAITVNGKKHNLGTYLTELAAASVYNNICKMYYSNNAVLNDIKSLDPEDILKMQTRKIEICKIIK